ncbi:MULTISPECIES: hypothetical protein [Thermus]|uniref:hypothetical protein n=1 Tax=Thermus TaxID=270 RepID=UPI001F453F50|nr:MULTISPECIES: hypothetical protein [Thermus]
MLKEAAYRHLLSLLPPGRYPREGGAADGMVRMLGGVEGRLLEELFALLREAFPHQASEEALAEHAKARLIPTLAGEQPEAFRARVVHARTFWLLAGTLSGVQQGLLVAGYRAHVREHYLDDPTLWAEFSVWLWPEVTAYISDWWDDGAGSWDDGTPWDYTLGATELRRIPNLIRELKPAHAKLCGLYYTPSPYDAWDDGAAWDDGGVWSPDAIQIL